MKKRVHLKKKLFKKNKKNIFLFVLIVTIIGVLFLLYTMGKKFTPLLIENAEAEISKFSTIIVNKAISQVLEDKINIDEIFTTVKNKDDTIQTIDFNPTIVNQVLNIATTVVQNNLKLLEEGELTSIGVYDLNLSNDRIEDLEKGIIIRIPVGILSNNVLLSNLGPKIPIRLHYIGDVNSNITTKITQYGINNAMITVYLHMEMTAQIILPFITESKILNYDIPIAIKVIQGTVPSYYGGSLLKDSSLYSLPFTEEE